ncbi:MAG: hypothetical protein WAX69_11605 [Victivallales bacterium]
MSEKIKMIRSLSEAVEYFKSMMDAHPERNALDATLAAMDGRRRKYPCFSLGYQSPPNDMTTGTDDLILPEVEMPDTPEGNLAREIIQLLNPLKMLNPVTACLGLGKGTGTLATMFGIPLDPSVGNSPAHTLTFDEILAMPEPEVETAGLMPEMRRKIEFIKRNLSPGNGLYIGLPDTQGPFNIAHAIAGEEILTGPYIDPEKFHAVMSRVTELWIRSVKTLREWIGPEWLDPVSKRSVHIAECSVNLVSPEIYIEFILPYDLKIAHAFKQRLSIHTCSGPHVFHATLDNLPDILFTEAGFIKNAVRGSTPVDEALEAIGDRQIVLNIGQEIWNIADAERILGNDLDLYEKHPCLRFGHTLMGCRTENKPMIREIHRRLDSRWAEKYGK